MSGEADRGTAYNAWKLAPFQNLLWWRMAQPATDFPITPEKLVEDRFEDQEPRP